MAEDESGDEVRQLELRHAVPRAMGQNALRGQERKNESAPSDDHAAPGVLYGQRAYLDRQREKFRAYPRRRALDAEA